MLHRMYTERGVRILPGNVATRCLGDGNVRQAELSGGDTLAVDFVVVGAGSRPNLELARQAGLTIGPEGGITVDQYLRSSDPEHLRRRGHRRLPGRPLRP